MADRPEEMAAFFDRRYDTYDEHMRGVVRSFDAFYALIAQPIAQTEEPIRVLDLGSGTGMQLQGVFSKAPNARVTCIDLSEKMSGLLLERFRERRGQLTVVIDNFVTAPLGERQFDYAISVYAMHHLRHDDKLALYRRIGRALKPGGVYIEGDYVEPKEQAARWLADYLQIRAEHGLEQDGLYHVDIPCSLEEEEDLFRQAGFGDFQVLWHEDTAAIYRVTAPMCWPTGPATGGDE